MNIKQQRERAGLTQSELADLVKVTTRTIERYEAGNRVPSAAMCELIRIKLRPMKCTQCGTEHTATANSNGLCFDCFKEAQPITQEPCSACDEYTSQGAEACPACGETIHYDEPLISI